MMYKGVSRWLCGVALRIFIQGVKLMPMMERPQVRDTDGGKMLGAHL